MLKELLSSINLVTQVRWWPSAPWCCFSGSRLRSVSTGAEMGSDCWWGWRRSSGMVHTMANLWFSYRGREHIGFYSLVGGTINFLPGFAISTVIFLVISTRRWANGSPMRRPHRTSTGSVPPERRIARTLASTSSSSRASSQGREHGGTSSGSAGLCPAPTAWLRTNPSHDVSLGTTGEWRRGRHLRAFSDCWDPAGALGRVHAPDRSANLTNVCSQRLDCRTNAGLVISEEYGSLCDEFGQAGSRAAWARPRTLITGRQVDRADGPNVSLQDQRRRI